MKSDKFNDALDFLDYELVDEFVKEQEAFKQRKARRKAILTFAPVAACFVILLSIGTAILGYTFGSNKVMTKRPRSSLRCFLKKREGLFLNMTVVLIKPL